MHPMLKKTLRVLIPKWVLDDVEARLYHPYWRRREVALSTGSRVKTVSLAGKQEKSSSRPPFKHVDEKSILEAFRQAGVKRILDVGCGRGNLVRYLEELGFDAYGMTINPAEVEAAGSKRVVLYDIQSEAGNNPLGAEKFDAILSFDCMEHLDAPLAGLRNVNHLLKQGGLFISYIPSARWTECDYHIIVYTPRQYRWMLNLAGFDLLRCSGRHFLSKRGVTYFAVKKYEDRPVYPGILE